VRFIYADSSAEDTDQGEHGLVRGEGGSFQNRD
jgi:hypothetical protein